MPQSPQKVLIEAEPVSRVITSVKLDHTEYRVPSSFILISAMFVSQGPTPAVWLSEWTLSLIRRALFERSELARPPYLSSMSSNEAGRGVNGFGYFYRNKSGSAAGPKPGNTENHNDTGVR